MQSPYYGTSDTSDTASDGLSSPGQIHAYTWDLQDCPQVSQDTMLQELGYVPGSDGLDHTAPMISGNASTIESTDKSIVGSPLFKQSHPVYAETH